jgi:hypothetical protein
MVWDYLSETSEQRRGACPASWDLFVLDGIVLDGKGREPRILNVTAARRQPGKACTRQLLFSNVSAMLLLLPPPPLQGRTIRRLRMPGSGGRTTTTQTAWATGKLAMLRPASPPCGEVPAALALALASSAHLATHT